MTRPAPLALVMALCLVTPVLAVDQPVAGKKLVIKRSGSGAEKLVWISKDPTFLFPPLGGADDPADAVGATLDVFSENEVGNGSFTMPAGAGSPGWLKKDATVDLYKFVNPDAPGGISPVKVAVLKEGKLLKVVARSTGLALTGAQGSVGIRLTAGTLRTCALFSPANAVIKADGADAFNAKNSTTAGFADCSDATLGGGIATTTTTTTTTTSTTTTTVFTADWGLDCFATMTCGPTHCPAFGAQCTDYIESIGLSGGTEMCFFDCMDGGLLDVTDCRDSCGGSAAPVCETGTAGGGGFTGVVTGPGKCTPAGFSASVSLGGTTSELKRVLVSFTTPIDESTLFSAPPPPCSGTCPTPGSACDAGAPYAAVPLSDVFRLQIGAASPPPEVCDRLGVATSVCKYSATGYAFILTPPGVSAPAAAPIDLTLFISCHVSDGAGGFLHFSTGDYFVVGSWPP